MLKKYLILSNYSPFLALHLFQLALLKVSEVEIEVLYYQITCVAFYILLFKQNYAVTIDSFFWKNYILMNDGSVQKVTIQIKYFKIL